MELHSVILHIDDITDNDLKINRTFKASIARKSILNTRTARATIIERITALESMH